MKSRFGIGFLAVLSVGLTLAVLSQRHWVDLMLGPAPSLEAPEAVSETEPQVPEPDPVKVRRTGIPRGATLATVLREFDVSGSEIHRLVEDTRSVYNLDRVRPGNRLVLEQELDGSFRSVRYDIDEEEYLVVRQERDRYVATRHKYDFQLEEERVFGEIRTNLSHALVSQGEQYALVIKVLDILGWDLDFTQLQRQDSITLLVEKKYRAGRFVKYGDVLAVRFDQMDRSFFGFLFADPKTGKEDYFDEGGELLAEGVPPGALQVRSAHHFRLLLLPIPSRTETAASASGGGLRCTHRHRGALGRHRHRRICRSQRGLWEDGEDPPQTIFHQLRASVPSPGAPWPARGSGAGHRESRIHRPLHGTPPGLSDPGSERSVPEPLQAPVSTRETGESAASGRLSGRTKRSDAAPEFISRQRRILHPQGQERIVPRLDSFRAGASRFQQYRPAS